MGLSKLAIEKAKYYNDMDEHVLAIETAIKVDGYTHPDDVAQVVRAETERCATLLRERAAKIVVKKGEKDPTNMACALIQRYLRELADTLVGVSDG